MVLDSGRRPFRPPSPPRLGVFGPDLPGRTRRRGPPPLKGKHYEGQQPPPPPPLPPPGPSLPPSPSLSLESDCSSPLAPSKKEPPPPMAPRGWMRRSESSCAVNRREPRARHLLRSASSLPHLAKDKEKDKDAGGRARRSPCLLVALRPANLEQEKAAFFRASFAYNPQFQYQEPLPTAVLDKYQEASGTFLPQALGIMHAVLERYGTYEDFEATNGGKLLSKGQIWSVIRKYLQKEGCSGEVVVHLTEDLLSQAVMMVENSRPTLAINLSGARQNWLEGMLRHEIGTHYIRGVNNARQPWHSPEGRQQFGLQAANPTEEGLASIHSVLFRKRPFLWRAALLYYTVYQAGRLSFADLFRKLEPFVRDAGVRWEYCVRAKRGQADTSGPGCFSKDQVYLDGILRILRHRHTIDFPLLAALGKVSYEDVGRLKGLGALERARIPHFMLDLERYMQQLDHIVATNRLDEEELERLLPD